MTRPKFDYQGIGVALQAFSEAAGQHVIPLVKRPKVGAYAIDRATHYLGPMLMLLPPQEYDVHPGRIRTNGDRAHTRDQPRKEYFDRNTTVIAIYETPTRSSQQLSVLRLFREKERAYGTRPDALHVFASPFGVRRNYEIAEEQLKRGLLERARDVRRSERLVMKDLWLENGEDAVRMFADRVERARTEPGEVLVVDGRPEEDTGKALALLLKERGRDVYYDTFARSAAQSEGGLSVPEGQQVVYVSANGSAPPEIEALAASRNVLVLAPRPGRPAAEAGQQPQA